MEPLASLTVAELLERLASKTPAPGGGAVSGLVGAQAAALASMVVAYSIGRKSLAAHQTELESLAQQLRQAQSLLLVLADADADAYAELSAMWKLPADHPDRLTGFEDAVREAIIVPRSVMAAAADLLRLCEKLVPITNPNLLSDLRAAAVLAESAAIAASFNIGVNAAQLTEASERDELEHERSIVLGDAQTRRARIVTGQDSA